jgi:hypothetical protein
MSDREPSAKAKAAAEQHRQELREELEATLQARAAQVAAEFRGRPRPQASRNGAARGHYRK